MKKNFLNPKASEKHSEKFLEQKALVKKNEKNIFSEKNFKC